MSSPSGEPPHAPTSSGGSYQDAHRRLLAHMKANGLKLTRQREHILEVFVGADKHVGVEELLALVRAAQPGIGHATVYRTMKLFVDSNIASERHFTDGATLYEPTHPDEEHHDHLICESCGLIVEFENEEIEQLQDQVAKRLGFELTSHKMELYGTCERCISKG